MRGGGRDALRREAEGGASAAEEGGSGDGGRWQWREARRREGRGGGYLEKRGEIEKGERERER